jgi:uracil-DNA glycosylase family 4
MKLATLAKRDHINCPAHLETFHAGKGEEGGLLILNETANRSGKMHKLLKATLDAVGWKNGLVYETSAVPCKYGGAPGRKASVPVGAMRACRPGVLHEIQGAKPRKILCLGRGAHHALTGQLLPVKKSRGRGFMFGDAYCVTTYSPLRVIMNPELFRDFANDVHKLIHKDKPHPAPRIDTRVATTHDEAMALIKEVSYAPKISFDLETNSLDTRLARVYSLGFGAKYNAHPDFDSFCVVIPGWLFYSSHVLRDKLKEFFKTYPGKIITHNGPQFDWPIMASHYNEYIEPLHPEDTMHMAYMLDERPAADEETVASAGSNRDNQGHSLKTLARVYYDAEDYAFDWDAFNNTPLAERPWNKLFSYHAEDLHYTIHLYDDLAREIDADSPRLWSVCRNISVPAAFAFGDISKTGAYVDMEYFSNLRAKIESEISSEHAELVAMGNAWLKKGPNFKKLVKKKGMTYYEPEEDYNPGSNPQTVKIVYDIWGLKPPMFSSAGSKLEKGRSKRTLERLALFTHRRQLQARFEREEQEDVKAEIAKQIHFLNIYLSWKQRAKAKSTYIDPLFERVDENSRVHPDILITGTSTGRTSYRGYNLQNIPALTRTTTVMGKAVRDGFVAEGEEWVLVEADFSQAELRMAAWLSQDPELLRVYREGKDFHTTAAAAIFKKPESEILGYERHAGKFVVFGILYGRGALSLVSGWEMDYLEEKGGKRWTVAEAQTFLDAFLDGFPAFKRWQEDQHAYVRKHKEIEAITGRKRRLPLTMDRGSASDSERRSVNMPIQSGTSELCLLAIVRVHKLLRRLAAEHGEVVGKITHTVHDSINMQVKKKYLDTLLPLVKETMEPKELRHIIPDAEPGQPVPVEFRVDVKVGTQWGSMGDYSKKVEDGKETANS